MKIQEKVVKQFNPIVITIETQDELDQLKGLLDYSIITHSLPILETLAKQIGYADNLYFKSIDEKIKEFYKKQLLGKQRIV